MVVWLGDDSHIVDGETAIAFYQTINDYQAIREKDDSLGINWMADPYLKHLDETLPTILLKPDTPFANMLVSKYKHKTGGGSSTSTQTVVSCGEVLYVGQDPVMELVWEAVGCFLNRRYFKRRWALQEAFHAREIEAYCGGHRISWNDLRTSFVESYP